jgi:hypothetical protein
MTNDEEFAIVQTVGLDYLDALSATLTKIFGDGNRFDVTILVHGYKSTHSFVFSTIGKTLAGVHAEADRTFEVVGRATDERTALN